MTLLEKIQMEENHI